MLVLGTTEEGSCKILGADGVPADLEHSLSVGSVQWNCQRRKVACINRCTEGSICTELILLRLEQPPSPSSNVLLFDFLFRMPTCAADPGRVRWVSDRPSYLPFCCYGFFYQPFFPYQFLRSLSLGRDFHCPGICPWRQHATRPKVK